MTSLVNKVALVTGASRGIGRAVALSLADAGAAVAVNYRERAADADDVVAAIRKGGGKAMAVAADVSDGTAVASMISAVERELGQVGVLVNNAGLAIIKNIDELTEEEFDRTIAVNLKSAFLCTKAVPAGYAGAQVGPHRQHLVRGGAWRRRDRPALQGVKGRDGRIDPRLRRAGREGRRHRGMPWRPR